MKILFLNDIPFNPLYGGVERVTDVLCRGLKEKGHIVYYLTGKATQSVSVFEFPAECFYFPEEGLFQSSTNINYYLNLIKKLEINVIVNQRGLENNFNQALSILPKEIKRISVIHSTPLAYFQVSKVIPLKLPRFMEVLTPVYRIILCLRHLWWARKHYDELFQCSDKVVLLSRAFAKLFKQYGIRVPENKITVIPNPNPFIIEQWDVNRKENVVLYAGRLSPEKNPLELLKIWHEIEMGGGNKCDSWTLFMVGDGELRQAMEMYIHDKGLKRVELLGRHQDMLPYYRMAKIVCLTSLYEGWGMALIEGMQNHCVPIAYDTYEALHDIIDDGDNGFSVPPFDSSRYVDCLVELMEDDAKLLKMSNNAYNKVARFNQDTITSMWHDLLMSIV